MNHREQDLERLIRELEHVKRSHAHDKRPPNEYKLIEIASARIGVYPSYGFRLMEEARQQNQSVTFRGKRIA